MESIISKVNLLKETYDTNCPFKIAKSLGIEIVFENLGNTLGYYNKHFRIKIIHINELENEYKKRFICAHELGHAIFHPDANTPFLKKHTLFSTERIEMEANFFAIRLLFSDYEEHISVDDAVKQYGIPQKLIKLHLDRKIF